MLRTSLRHRDISCRYGGEGFVLIFPDSSLEDTGKRVEEIRVLVRDIEVRQGSRRLESVTVSAGRDPPRFAPQVRPTSRGIRGRGDSTESPALSPPP